MSWQYPCSRAFTRSKVRERKMGKKQGAVATDGVNRRRMSNNRKRNWQNKCNRKNILEKKLKDPGIYLTSKPMCVTVYVPAYTTRCTRPAIAG